MAILKLTIRFTKESSVDLMSNSLVLDDFVMLGKSVPEPVEAGRRVFVCSAGYSPSLKSLIRIYPISLKSAPKNWDISRVMLERDAKDSREETWKLAGEGDYASNSVIRNTFQRVGTYSTTKRRRELLDHARESGCFAECKDIPNREHRSLCLVDLHPNRITGWKFDPNNVDDDRLWEHILIHQELSLKLKDRFHWKPRLQFRCPQCQTKDPHDLQIRSWGVYEFFRRNGEHRRDELWAGLSDHSGGLNLHKPRTLLLGNQNAHRNSWLIISVLQGESET